MTSLLVADQVHLVHVDYKPDFGKSYYRTVDPGVFRIWNAASGSLSVDREDLWSPLKDVDDARIHALMDLRVRFEYLNFLESLWAHLIANIQAPHVPELWLELYKPSQLRDMVEAIFVNRAGHAHCPMLEDWDALCMWLFGLNRVELPSSEAVSREVASITSILSVLAGDYTSKANVSEYNAIKHGARVGSQLRGFSIRMRQNDDPEGREICLRSDQGTHLRRLQRRPRTSKSHAQEWETANVSVGWDPSRDLRMSRLASMLFFNLARCRQPNFEPPLYGFSGIDLEGAAAAAGVGLIRSEWKLTPGPLLSVSKEQASDQARRQAEAHAAQLKALKVHYLRHISGEE